ncbi:hypothetical protein EV182_001154 [Spiromyces aspiralis]|uniref:Uncharacterized protein n=1 Tax=Spiromyces aspiralis TaxID=68401 RepID=A0ACC1HHI8_9FUNG|nr:hypothetical protein EV182_001154 [Spiromyces aspiralis]
MQSPPSIDPRMPLLLRLEIAAAQLLESEMFEGRTERDIFDMLMRYGNINPGHPIVSAKSRAKMDLEDLEDPVIAVYKKREDRLLKGGGKVDMAFGVTMFFSVQCLRQQPFIEAEQFRQAPRVVEAWLRYLIEHDVCVEYNDDIYRALAVTERAKIELVNCKQLAMTLPGKFNDACSMLFGGSLKDLGDSYAAGTADTSWVSASNGDTQGFGIITLSEAQAVYARATGGMAPEEAEYLGAEPHDVHVEEQLAGDHEEFCAFKCRRWDREAGKPISDEDGGRPFTLYFEREVAQHMCPGIYLEADLHQLSNGVHYIDQVTGVWPSYTPFDEM